MPVDMIHIIQGGYLKVREELLEVLNLQLMTTTDFKPTRQLYFLH